MITEIFLNGGWTGVVACAHENPEAAHAMTGAQRQAFDERLRHAVEEVQVAILILLDDCGLRVRNEGRGPAALIPAALALGQEPFAAWRDLCGELKIPARNADGRRRPGGDERPAGQMLRHRLSCRSGKGCQALNADRLFCLERNQYGAFRKLLLDLTYLWDLCNCPCPQYGVARL